MTFLAGCAPTITQPQDPLLARILHQKPYNEIHQYAFTDLDRQLIHLWGMTGNILRNARSCLDLGAKAQILQAKWVEMSTHAMDPDVAQVAAVQLINPLHTDPNNCATTAALMESAENGAITMRADLIDLENAKRALARARGYPYP